MRKEKHKINTVINEEFKQSVYLDCEAVKMRKIVIDGYGGDNAPKCVVDGAITAVSKDKNIEVTILGDEKELNNLVKEKGYNGEQIKICHTTEKIEMAEHPVAAIRKKKDSSLVRGMKMVREKEAEAFVSAGNSGAVLVGGQTIVGRLKNVKSAPLATVLPTKAGQTLLLDCGARVDVSAEILVQYALLAKAYYRAYFNKENPTVGILNIGAEEEKGNELVRNAFPLLKENNEINFVGSVEARDIPFTDVDIILTEGFCGNVALKMFEGTGKLIFSELKGAFMSSFSSKIGALLVKKPLKKALKQYDPSEHGGAPLLGCKGIVLKTHGSSTYKEISNTILQASKLIENDFISKLEEELNYKYI